MFSGLDFSTGGNWWEQRILDTLMEGGIFPVKEKNSERYPGVLIGGLCLEHFAYLHQNFAFSCHNPDWRMLNKYLAKAQHRKGPPDHIAYQQWLWIWISQAQTYFLTYRSWVNHVTLSLYHCQHLPLTHLLENTKNDITDTEDKKGTTFLE